MCSVAAILMNKPILVKNLLEFHSHKQPQPSLFISSDTKLNALPQIPTWKQLLFQPGHFFAPDKGLLNMACHMGNVFSRLAKAQQLLFHWKPRCWAVLEKLRIKMCFVPLLFSTKTTICISSRFYCWTIAFVICMSDFTAEMLQVIYFVIRCEPKFSSVRLEIFKCSWVKCLLKTNLSSTMKPSIF